MYNTKVSFFYRLGHRIYGGSAKYNKSYFPNENIKTYKRKKRYARQLYTCLDLRTLMNQDMQILPDYMRNIILIPAFTCTLSGDSMMTRKDSPFIAYWNEGFRKIQSSGAFIHLCAKAAKEHGELHVMHVMRKQTLRTKIIKTYTKTLHHSHLKLHFYARNNVFRHINEEYCIYL